MLHLILQAAAYAKLKRSASSYSFDGSSAIEPIYEEDNLPSLPVEEIASEHFTVESSSHTAIDDLDSVDLTSWQRIRRKVKRLVCNSIFETFITLCILFNTLAMACEHHEMNPTFSGVLDVFNYVSIVIRKGI